MVHDLPLGNGLASLEFFEESVPLKLNLGCGYRKIDGFVNVDKFPACSPDRVADLEAFPWPFESDTADEVHMIHVLEHLGATTECFFSIIKELYRVCKHGAPVLIKVPHPRSDAFLGDPTHVRPITSDVLSLFSKQANREFLDKGLPNSPLAFYLDVDFRLISTNFTLSPRWGSRMAEGKITEAELYDAYLDFSNVVDEITIRLEVVKS